MKPIYCFPMTFSLLLCSYSGHAMDDDTVLEKIYDPAIKYSPGAFKHSKDGPTTLSTPPQHAHKPYTQRALVYGKNPQALKQEKILKIIVPGKDGRTRVSQPSDWPHSITTQLSMTFDGQDYGGSGVIVGPHQILTCGHNVYDHDISQWAEKISVYPALNESDAPFGEAKVVKAYTFKGWVNQQDPQRDMALLILNKSIGDYTGWGGLLSLDDASLSQEKVHITGYPGDKGLKQMWTMGHTLKTIKPEQFDYEIDTYSGQSGSPIWINKWGMPMILGVHTLGNQSINSGVRLSNKKFTILLKIMSDNSVPNPSPVPTPVPNPSLVIPSQPPFSFEEWRKGLLSRPEPWAKVLWNECTSQDATWLDLKDRNIGDAGVIHFTKGHFTALTGLLLGNNQIGDTGALGLGTGGLPALTWLSLSNNRIGDRGAKFLARSDLTALTWLALDNNKIGDAGAQTLKAGNLKALKTLYLHGNNISEPSAIPTTTAAPSPVSSSSSSSAITNSSQPAFSFEEWRKGLLSINEPWAKEFLRECTAQNITSARLSYGYIGDEALLYLIKGNITALIRLDLRQSGISARGAQALATGNFTALTDLYLWKNKLGDAGAQYLANGNLSALTTLNLDDNNIGDAGAQSLANGNLIALTYLNVTTNNIGAAGAQSLANGNLTNLKVLILDDNKIDDAGTYHLANGKLTNLETLWLNSSNIGAAGAQYLANGNLMALRYLVLTLNHIGDTGAQVLAIGNLSKLTNLVLYKNNIGDAGAQALVKGNFNALTRLSLGENNIGTAAQQALKSRYPKAEITF